MTMTIERQAHALAATKIAAARAERTAEEEAEGRRLAVEKIAAAKAAKAAADAADLRGTLRRAIERRDEAERKAAGARAALDKAAKLVADAQNEIAKYSALSAEIAHFLADRIASATLSGEEPDLALSPELAAKRSEAAEAEARLAEAKAKLEAVKSASGVLENGRSRAEAVAHEEGLSVQRAAADVFRDEVERRVAEYEKARNQLWALEDALAGCLVFAARSPVFALPDTVAARMNRGRQDEAISRHGPLLAEPIRWRDFVSNLHREQAAPWEQFIGRLTRPDAKLEEESA